MSAIEAEFQLKKDRLAQTYAEAIAFAQDASGAADFALEDSPHSSGSRRAESSESYEGHEESGSSLTERSVG